MVNKFCISSNGSPVRNTFQFNQFAIIKFFFFSRIRKNADAKIEIWKIHWRIATGWWERYIVAAENACGGGTYEIY